VTDAPVTAPAVLPDVPAVEDKLNFGPYARTLLDIILNPDTQTPLTIGIFGSWGSGKTSLMKMIEYGLKRAQESEGGRQTFSVWFNAWLYSKEEALWRALVLQVLSGVRKIRSLDTTARDELNALADQLYRAVGPAELGHLSIMAAELLKEEGTGSAQITLALQHGLDFLQNIAEARQQGELAAVQSLRDQVRRATAALEQERIESLERFQAQFEALIEKHVLPRGYLVIFVDDLDRCLPDKAVEVLEAIKLFLDVPGCIFILGIDRDVVERGIRLRYGELGGMGNREGVQLQVDRETVERGTTGAAKYRAFLQELYTDDEDVIDGERYLEKIVQIPFVLPPISPQAMGSFVAQLTPNLPDERCGFVFVRGLEPNPRQVKRALNIFALLWALAQNQPYLAGRVSPVRLAKLVVLQQRHGNLYERLRENPSLLIAWERAFRVLRSRETYQEWVRTAGFDGQSAPGLWSLDAPFPNELEGYEEQAALEQLLTMHPLTGDDAREANFVDMTPEEMYDLIFLAHTAEGGVAPTSQEPGIKGVKQPPSTFVSVPETGPIALQEFAQFSEEEASYMARQTLELVAKMSLSLASDTGAVDYVMKELMRTGRRLNEWLRRSVPQDVMATLADEASAINVSFGGAQGSLMARLPWEMVYDGDEDPSFEKISFSGFWGGRHVIERPLVYSYATRGLPPPPLLAIPIRQEKPDVGLVLDRGIDASAAMEVFDEWDKAGRIRLKSIQSPEAFRASLMDDPEDIYVFYGRGWQEVGESVIGVGEGSRLRAGEMLNWVSKAPLIKGLVSSQQDDRRALLFYFCLQGDPVQELDWSAWASALQQLGAAGVVAPLSYTPGGWPLQFMGYFFDSFLNGGPLGETLRGARLGLFEKTQNPLGLLYVHFGSPALRLVRSEETDEGKKD